MLRNVNRQLFFCPGIYALYSEKYGKIYIGSSLNVYKRVNGHVRKLQRNIHENKYLQNFYNKYGKDSLAALVLCRFPKISSKDLRKEEQKYIDLYFDKKYCFNLSKNAKYFQRTDEQNKKHGVFLKKFWKDNYETQKEIVCNNLKKAHIVNKLLIEKGVHRPAHNKGKKTPEYVRKKQSESAKKRKTINAVCVKVNMIDSLGNVVRTFDSARNAAKIVTGNASLGTNILHVCNGSRRRACGYFWEYTDRPNKLNIGQVWAGKELFKAYFDKNVPGIIVKAKNETMAKKLLKEILIIEKGEKVLYSKIRVRRYYSEDMWARSINCLWKRV